VTYVSQGVNGRAQEDHLPRQVSSSKSKMKRSNFLEVQEDLNLPSNDSKYLTSPKVSKFTISLVYK